MKLLASSFRKQGFDFVQLKRQGHIALFHKTKPTGAASFEVVKVQSHKAYTIAGNTIEATEAMPSSESWGTKGWTYQTLERANRRFYQLTT